MNAHPSSPLRTLLAAVGRALGKAVIAGVGMELAKVAADQIRQRFGPKAPVDGDPKDAQETLSVEDQLDAVRHENATLRAEVERLKSGKVGAGPGG